jgi:hypothetical protein
VVAHEGLTWIEVKNQVRRAAHTFNAVSIRSSMSCLGL